MARLNDVDDLFNAKDAFYVGNYQQAINDAQNAIVSSYIGFTNITLLYIGFMMFIPSFR